jgi:hypothetical protein
MGISVASSSPGRWVPLAGALVLPIVAAVLLLGGLWLRSSSAGFGGAPFAVEGIELTTALATSAISESRAWDAVESEYGSTYLAGARRSALVHVHDPNSLVGDRDAWVFEITGLSIEGPKPLLAKSIPRLTRAYVFVDASSGEVIAVRLDE